MEAYSLKEEVMGAQNLATVQMIQLLQEKIAQLLQLGSQNFTRGNV